MSLADDHSSSSNNAMESKPAPTRPFASHRRQGDHIGKALRQHIEHSLLQSFDTFDIQIQVYPSQTANRLYDRNDTWIGFDEYNFERWGHQPKRMKARMSQDGKPRIFYKRHWRPVSAFLQRLQPEEDWNRSGSSLDLMEGGWRQQARWWLTNGKKFRLLELPAEIREIIYGHVFGTLVEPFRTSRFRQLNPSTKLVSDRGRNFNLLLTSKLVYKEASNILFLFTTFVVQHYRMFRRLTDSSTLRSNVRQLDLALSHDEFFHLFGEGLWLPPDRRSSVRQPSAAVALRHMKLDRLSLIFAAPSTITKTGMFDDACQKGAVKLIMEAAWPYIRGQPVELSGYVKKSQKIQYEAELHSVRKSFEFWQSQNEAAGIAKGSLAEHLEEIDDKGGVRLNGDDKEMDEPSANLTEAGSSRDILVCQCQVPCTLETWSEDGERENESEC